MSRMSSSRSRIARFVIPFALAACRFELPEPESEQVVIDADVGRSCGNSVHEPGRGEDCDTGGNTQACDGDCTVPECGDGYLNPGFVPPGKVQSEQCDDGNGLNKDDCPDGFNGTCKPASCGDGHVRSLGDNPEECDKGPANSNTKPDGCRTSCRKAYCGDGVKDKNEECDGSSGCASPDELCWPGCKCLPGTPPPPLHGDAGR